MRKIKFRAWNKITKEMSKPFCLEELRDEDNPAHWQNMECKMQYTGLKDKNGIEIYEGELMVNPTIGDLWQVFFKDGIYQVGLLPSSGTIKHSKNMIDKDGFVHIEYLNSIIKSWYSVGNIYENPKLIKK